MPFPEYERVKYAKQPLENVICQVRFPPILRIDSELPAAFQEKLRARYPVLNERESGTPTLPLPLELQKIISADFKMSIGADKKIYDFVSGDGNWQVSLARGFTSLYTTKYDKWDDFKERFYQSLDALEEIYGPSFYMRVGLRYQDIIRRSALGLKDVPWRELLQAHVVGELVNPEIEGRTAIANREIVIKLENEGEKLKVRHGLRTEENTGELCYIIDADFSTTARTEVADVRGKLDYFNRLAGRFFRWCITDRLHQSLEPSRL